MSNIRIILLCLLCVFALYCGISHAGSLGVADSSHDLSRTSTGSQFKYATRQICVFCHTPHGANAQVTTTSYFNNTTGEYIRGTGGAFMLWNRALSNAGTLGTGYRLYDSSTMSMTVTQVRIQSLLCLSCHDGVGALNVLQNLPNDAVDDQAPFGAIDWHDPDPELPEGMKPDQIGDYSSQGINIGGRTPSNNQTYVELRNDHPISVNYETAINQDGDGFVAMTNAGSHYYVSDPKIKLYNKFVECTTCHDPHNEGEAGTGNKYPFLWVTNQGSNLCTSCHNK